MFSSIVFTVYFVCVLVLWRLMILTYLLTYLHNSGNL